ncbi:MAG: NAD(P)-dependent oxidoreductase [Desulfovibrio sp.]|jgi:3-hydroxyisobutyrate dehydrogenase-like beta-hydroxyacid dehydrogenase|nr:NAD(P)-dependent oxidoreductase [Desulfovibrio sp.]
MKAAFLGLGRMGTGMAGRILKAGLSLDVWNRTPEKSAPFAALGATVHEGPVEAASGAAIVFTMLADDAALEAVMGPETIGAMIPAGVHVSMSTISVGLAQRMTDDVARLGRYHVSCPVFGRPAAAEGGTLQLCLAGGAAAKKTIRPYLDPMGKVWDFGDVPFAANSVKLAGNFMISSLIELLAEAFSLVEKSGVQPEDFFNLMSNSLFDAPVVKTYGRLLLDGNFDVAGFAAKLGLKDVGLIRDAARRTATPLPMASLVEDRFLRILAKGWAEKDWSVVGLSQRTEAGL